MYGVWVCVEAMRCRVWTSGSTIGVCLIWGVEFVCNTFWCLSGITCNSLKFLFFICCFSMEFLAIIIIIIIKICRVWTRASTIGVCLVWGVEFVCKSFLVVCWVSLAMVKSYIFICCMWFSVDFLSIYIFISFVEFIFLNNV